MFSAHVLKKSGPGHSKSDHQVTSSDPTQEKVWMLVIATPNDGSLWNFQWLIAVTVSIRFLSRNFDIGKPRSGQFCDPFVISQGEKIERCFFWTKTIQNTLKHRVTSRLGILNRNIATSDPRYVTKVISGHEISPTIVFAIHFDRDKLEQ